MTELKCFISMTEQVPYCVILKHSLMEIKVQHQGKASRGACLLQVIQTVSSLRARFIQTDFS